MCQEIVRSRNELFYATFFGVLFSQFGLIFTFFDTICAR